MLKRVLLAGAGLILSAGFSGSDPGPAATVARDILLAPEALRIREVGGLSRFDLSGGASGFPAGAPDLPTMTVILALPPGTRAVSARVEILESTGIPGSHRPALVPPPGQAELRAAPSDLGTIPDNPVLRVSTGRMRGHVLGSVLVAPVSWDARTGALRLATRFRVVLETADATLPSDSFVPERESEEGQRTFQEDIERLAGEPPFSNRTGTRPLTLPSGPFAPGFRPTVDGSPVEMVIVTTADQESEYQRLADFRTRTGLSTVVRTVEWIETNYPRGADPAETIRNFLRDAAAKWGTVWVLLGGDTGKIPVRHVLSDGFGTEEVTTDLYYGDLDGNWNADGDSRFGEGDLWNAPRDLVDLYPDVWVGRLPSNSAAEAKILVDKTLQYSRNPPLGYQKDVLLPAEVLFPDNWQPGQTASFDGAILAEAVVDTLPPGHRVVRMYENHTAWPGALPEVKSSVVDSIDAGFHLVQFVGHGFINTISVGLGSQTLGNVDAESFTNGAEQFLLVTMDCTSSAIDFNCIAERFLLNPGGGAVASIGATEVEYPTTAYLYQQEFYHQLFWGGAPELGRALSLARVPFVVYSSDDNPHRWTQLSLILLGDPSLAFWTGVPAALTVSHAATFPLGGGSFLVTVARAGQPVTGARVTLSKDGDEYASAVTSSFGQAAVPFHPDLTGTFTVGVTVPDCLPYLGSATVAPRTLPYLFAQSQVLADGVSGAAQGNGDGRLDAGETAEVRFTIKNNGCCTTAGGIAGTLTSADPYLTVTDGTSAWPNLAPGASATASDPLVIRLARGAPDRTEAHATLTLTGTGGPFSEDVIFYVHAPVVEYREQSFRDTVGNGNGDGHVTPNEDVVILPVIRNTGQGALRSVTLRLRSADPAVMLVDTVSVLGNVAVGAVAGNPADGLRLRFLNMSSPHPFTVTVKDAYAEVFSRRLDLTAPGGVSGTTARGTASSISLVWDPVGDADLWGYVIHRASAPGGPFARANPWTVLRTSTYEDAGLPGFSRFYYRVAAMDSSGNPGPWSAVVTATTSLPLHTGWPVDVGVAVPAGVNVADLNGDGKLEVLGAGAEILALTADGQDFVDGDLNAQTRGPITDTDGTTFWNTPAVGDVDGNGTPEVAAIGWGDCRLYLVNAQGQPLPGWPKNANPLGLAATNPVGSVCLADVDADGDLEIFATVGRAILGWHHNGAEIADGDANAGTSGVLAVTGSDYSYGTPSVANVDADPYREILAGMRDGKLYVFRHDGSPYPGFPFAAGGDITSGPAVGDIDRDGRMEIVFGSSNGKVWALRADLSQAAGFPVSIPLTEDWDSSPALGDVTGDGAPDVVIADSDGFLHVLSGVNGTEPAGYPVGLAVTGTSVSSRSSPVLVDLDGNGSIDVLVGDRAGRLHAFNSQGQPLAGFFIQTANRIEAGAAVADVDGDGLSEVVVESLDQQLYVWDTPWTFDPARAPWPMMKGNPAHTGFLGDSGFGAPVGMQEDPSPSLLLTAGPNPFRRAATLRYRIPEGAGRLPVRLVIYDLAGRVVKILVAEEQTAGLHAVTWNGDDEAARRVGAGVYLFRLRVGPRGGSGKIVLLP